MYELLRTAVWRAVLHVKAFREVPGVCWVGFTSISTVLTVALVAAGIASWTRHALCGGAQETDIITAEQVAVKLVLVCCWQARERWRDLPSPTL